MSPITYLKNLAIEYYQDQNELLKFYNNCLLLFMWMIIVAGFVALYIIKS